MYKSIELLFNAHIYIACRYQQPFHPRSGLQIHLSIRLHYTHTDITFNIVKSSEFLEVIQSVDNKLGLSSIEKLRKSIDDEFLAFSTKNATILQDDTFLNVDFDL